MLARGALRHARRPLARSLAGRAALDAEEREVAVVALKRRGWRDDSPERDSVSKTFEFDSFNDAFGWMARVALFAEATDHHPEWRNVYGTVDVTLSTHSAGGVSHRDAAMADFMDSAAPAALDVADFIRGGPGGGASKKGGRVEESP